MNKVVLIFPDVASMAEFVLTEKISQAETNSSQRTLVGLLTEKQIAIACNKFYARLAQISRIG